MMTLAFALLGNNNNNSSANPALVETLTKAFANDEDDEDDVEPPKKQARISDVVNLNEDTDTEDIYGPLSVDSGRGV